MTHIAHEDLRRIFTSLRLRFTNRLNGALLEDALANFDFAEYALGIEALCDYLGENRIPLDDEDLAAIEHAATASGADKDRIRVELTACPPLGK